MSAGTILLIASNASQIEVQGGKLCPTGYYLNELVVPTMAVLNAGYDVVLATPSGAKPVLDEVSRVALHFGNSVERLQEAVRFVEEHPVMQKPRSLRAVLEEGLEGYTGLFVPGGQAPVVDLMQDPTLGEILRHFHEHQKTTALLCHGPIATLAALPHAGEYRAALVEGNVAKASSLAKGWQYAGYRMTIWSNLEERWLEDNILHAKVLFRTVDALQTAGGEVTTSTKVFVPHIEEDRELITGQNPASDHALAGALVNALDQRRSKTQGTRS
jgi:putative intracellular protease/amidase